MRGTIGFWRRGAEKCREFVYWLDQDKRARLVAVEVYGDGLVRFDVDFSAFDSFRELGLTE
jgi:hypothetical protein